MAGTASNDRNISEEVERRQVLFEQTWGQPSAPSIEQLLDEMPEVERPDLLRELLYIEFEFTRRKTDEWHLEPYLLRFPGYESIVREVAEAVGQYTVFKRRNIAGYTLLEELGRGGMGVVYRAKSDLLNNFVAFKMINRRMVDNSEALRRFTRELEMIGRLRHPNIVEAKHAGIAPDDSPFLVMELVQGITLGQWSRENPHSGTQRMLKVCEIVRDAARGLQAIHEAGLVHRDIKPGNIMLLPDGQVKILDLGLAKLREHLAENTLETELQTRQGHLLGTPGYIAPEQLHSPKHVDIRADIYSLGCTFFFLLNGRAPSESPQREFSVAIPRKLRTILDRMLAPDPASRFREPWEVIKALEAFLALHRSHIGRVLIVATVLVAVGTISILLASTFYRKDVSRQTVNFETPGFVGKETLPELENAAAGRPSMVDVRAAVDLRYQGDGEQASEVLRKLENDLRARPFSGSDELLAEVLSAQGDCVFFAGIASGAIPEKAVRRLIAWYEEALKLAENSSNSLRQKLLCKLSVLNAPDYRTFLGKTKTDEKMISPYLHFAEAIALSDENDWPLRGFVEQFELSTEPELATREALDLRLFALERLINRDTKNDRSHLSQDLRSLDAILLAPYQDENSCVYLNRFFDLAVRASDPTDYGRLARYLCRLRPQGTAGSRFPPGSTLILFYFSPWSDTNGFAIYYPAERQEAKCFELPWNRNEVKEAIKRGDSLTLDAELVERIRRDIESGTPIVLSWDDTVCWPLRRDAFSSEDWPFDEAITIEEMMGQMK